MLINHLFWLLPGFIPFASHAGSILEENIYINMNYSYPNEVFSQNVHIFGRKIFFANFAQHLFHGKKQKNNNTRNTYKILSYIVVG